jgi:proteasome lid subunit RPN8/RPN11
MALRIHPGLLDELRRYAEHAYPNECCGALLGHFSPAGDRTVQRVVACTNAETDSPHTNYEISSLELLRVQREAHVAAQQIVGFYHSHPDHPARWSSTDLAEAHWTGCSYVITCVERGRATATSSFLLLDEQTPHFEDETIVMNECEVSRK